MRVGAGCALGQETAEGLQNDGKQRQCESPNKGSFSAPTRGLALGQYRTPLVLCERGLAVARVFTEGLDVLPTRPEGKPKPQSKTAPAYKHEPFPERHQGFLLQAIAISLSRTTL